jgi:hypothetical protein
MGLGEKTSLEDHSSAMQAQLFVRRARVKASSMSRPIRPGANPSARNCYVAVTRMPTVDRIKTAKVTFAVATPNGSHIVTDRCRVPAPAVSKIALGVPARKVRGVTMMFPVRERVG